MAITLVFLAAGFGTRFAQGIKQLEPVGPNGEVLMEYAAHDALRAGFDRVVFILRRDIEREFREGVGRRMEKRCEVAYAYQELEDLPKGFSVPAGRTKPWGTGQALLACRNIIHEPFCVLNADDYYGTNAFRDIAAFLRGDTARDGGLHGCMAGYVLGNTLSPSGAVTRGICAADDEGMLTGITETRGICLREGAAWAGDARLDSNAIASMNIWGLPADFLQLLEEGFAPFLRSLSEETATKQEYLLPEIVGEMLRRGRGDIRVLPTRDTWFGMTYAEDRLTTRACIQELVQQGVYPEKL